MSNEFGKLEVSDPTQSFLDWLNATGLIYDLTVDPDNHPTYLTINNYMLGLYNGIVGLGAWFDGELIK